MPGDLPFITPLKPLFWQGSDLVRCNSTWRLRQSQTDLTAHHCDGGAPVALNDLASVLLGVRRSDRMRTAASSTERESQL
ncbi:Hypothetical protein FKW44_013876 [Caligus rogercresseyi]|uniref:Uncharacterized protein n=1 Tax=Caligus rogercresseyi TaxID=217165 RepID=A0A7T8GY62_CALRO|nr:Hypothetical protein FKW44_013876 [Caligus rogercresseyi]